jgi:hypothetical protein
LKLAEESSGSEQEHGKPEDGSERTSTWFARALNYRLNGLTALLADQIFDLRGDLPLRGLSTKNNPSDTDGDNEKRRERENCVIGECRSKPRGFVRCPLRPRFFQDRPES